jgi:aromatic-L-amino-acid decarboxylase
MKEGRKLQDGHVRLDMSPEEFRAAGHRLVERIADFLGSLPARPLTVSETPEDVRKVLGAERGLPLHGAEASSLLEWTSDLLFDHSLFNGHPRFWGYITSSAAPIL